MVQFVTIRANVIEKRCVCSAHPSPGYWRILYISAPQWSENKKQGSMSDDVIMPDDDR